MQIGIRIVTFVVITFTTFSSALAQTNYEDVVYLKNGSIIHGLIIEQVPNQSIKIQTRDGNVFVYRMDDVEKMTKELMANGRPAQSSSAPVVFREKGYINITELSFGFGLGSYSQDMSYGLQTVNGYLFNPNFSLGFGVGVDKYKSTTFLPLFADFRAYFLKEDVTPYFAGGIGYALCFQTGNKGGVFVNPSLGVRFTVSPKAALDFSIGYRLQENTYDYSYSYFGGYDYSMKQSADFFNFKFGVAF